MLDVVWKLVQSVIGTRIKTVVQFHNILHRFFTASDKGTSIMELKLAQELESVDQDPLFLVFLDLSKVYKKLYQGRLLPTLAGYEAEPKLRVLLAEFWSIQELVTCHNDFHGTQFRVTRGTTQGVLASPTLFNVSVDSVICH